MRGRLDSDGRCLQRARPPNAPSEVPDWDSATMASRLCGGVRRDRDAHGVDGRVDRVGEAAGRETRISARCAVRGSTATARAPRNGEQNRSSQESPHESPPTNRLAITLYTIAAPESERTDMETAAQFASAHGPLSHEQSHPVGTCGVLARWRRVRAQPGTGTPGANWGIPDWVGPSTWGSPILLPTPLEGENHAVLEKTASPSRRHRNPGAPFALVWLRLNGDVRPVHPQASPSVGRW